MLYRLRQNGRRAALVTVLTLLAAIGGVWAQSGTDVTLTKTDNEQVSVSGTAQEGTAPNITLVTGWAHGDEQTTQQPPAPETTTVFVNGQVDRFQAATGRSCNASASMVTQDKNAVNVGPGASTGSVNGSNMPGTVQVWGPTPADWGTGAATVSVSATAGASVRGPGNTQTSTWYSPDRKEKVTTHFNEFQNVANSGRIRVSATNLQPLPNLPLGASCNADVAVSGGTIFSHRQETHAQLNQ